MCVFGCSPQLLHPLGTDLTSPLTGWQNTHAHTSTQFNLTAQDEQYLSLSVTPRNTVAAVSLHTLLHLVCRPHTSSLLSLTGNCGHVASPKKTRFFALRNYAAAFRTPQFCAVYHFIFDIFEVIEQIWLDTFSESGSDVILILASLAFLYVGGLIFTIRPA